MRRPDLELRHRIPRYLAEAVIGFVLAGLVVLALVAAFVFLR